MRANLASIHGRLVIGPPQVRPGPVLRGGQHQAGAERRAREEAGAEGRADGDQEE